MIAILGLLVAMVVFASRRSSQVNRSQEAWETKSEQTVAEWKQWDRWANDDIDERR